MSRSVHRLSLGSRSRESRRVSCGERAQPGSRLRTQKTRPNRGRELRRSATQAGGGRRGRPRSRSWLRARKGLRPTHGPTPSPDAWPGQSVHDRRSLYGQCALRSGVACNGRDRAQACCRHCHWQTSRVRAREVVHPPFVAPLVSRGRDPNNSVKKAGTSGTGQKRQARMKRKNQYLQARAILEKGERPREWRERQGVGDKKG